MQLHESIIYKIISNEELTQQERTELAAIMHRAVTCDEFTSFDQGVNTLCIRTKDHKGKHKGISRNQLIEWETFTPPRRN